MPLFRTLIRGENFQMEMDGKIQTVGFYTTRIVQVTCEDLAEDKAVALIRDDPQLIGAVLNDISNPPMIYVEELEEIADSYTQLTAAGFSFFLAES